MFAYLGLESATVPAGDVVDPARTIPRSTLLGVAVASTLYVLGTTVVLGVIPRAELVNSTAPFADAARVMWGSWAATVVSLAIVVSSIGSLNGWTLLMGQVPMAAAQDGLFPRFFGRQSSAGVPAIGIVISAGLATALVLVQGASSSGFAAIYALIATREGGVRAAAAGVSAVEVVAFIFSIFVIYGCGAEAVLYGMLMLLAGIPVYVWQRLEHQKLKGVAAGA
jgi:basic amino acid/polyamine antiporter, APA family